MHTDVFLTVNSRRQMKSRSQLNCQLEVPSLIRGSIGSIVDLLGEKQGRIHKVACGWTGEVIKKAKQAFSQEQQSEKTPVNAKQGQKGQ